MVTIGFVVEGASEKKLVESDGFRKWAKGQGLEVKDPVVNAGGGGNLCSHNLEPYVAGCRAQTGAEYVIILTDLECDPCVSQVHDRVGRGDHRLCVARKALEAWFLADDQAMAKWLKEPGFHEERPEATTGMPWDRLKEMAMDRGMPGPGRTRLLFARKMVNACSFSIERAANHPHCPSAAYFVRTLRALAKLDLSERVRSAL